MAEPEHEDPGGVEFSRTRVILALLLVGGCFIACAALAWGLTRFWQMSQDGSATFVRFISDFAVVLAGVGLASLAWGLEEVIRRLDALRHARGGGVHEAAARPPARLLAQEETNAQILGELVVLMREVRDISLLNDEQRSLRLSAQGQAVISVVEREVPALLREHNWIEARRRVQRARERFPNLKQWDAFERQIEDMRTQVEAHDVEAAERQVADLAALGAWDRVAEVVEELMERHPDSERAHALQQRIRTDRNKAEQTQRTSLLNQAQDAANRRDWGAAVSTANTLIEHYPRSSEAHALRMQLPTLRENAEIKQRQELEARFRQLWKEGRVSEALEVAERLLDDYPNSPQARVLREQLPKLRAAAGY